MYPSVCFLMTCLTWALWWPQGASPDSIWMMQIPRAQIRGAPGKPDALLSIPPGSRVGAQTPDIAAGRALLLVAPKVNFHPNANDRCWPKTILGLLIQLDPVRKKMYILCTFLLVCRAVCHKHRSLFAIPLISLHDFITSLIT